MTQSLPLSGNGAASPGNGPAVLCSGISYRFGRHVAVDQVSLRIEPGETFGLLGPNGAGKPDTGLRQFF